MTTFALVHGAWQGGWTWQRVTPLLRGQGHQVILPTLTGVGDRTHLLSPQVGLETHIQDVLATLANEGAEKVVLVGHSYSGQVIAGVASARPDLIGRLVFLDAFVPHDGASATALQLPEIAHHYRESVDRDGFGWLIPPRSLEVLGVTDPGDVAWLQSLMVPHPYKTFNDPVRVTDESLRLPAAFIECTEWMRAFRPMREVAESRGWPVSELPSGHQPMTTAPEALAEALLTFA